MYKKQGQMPKAEHDCVFFIIFKLSHRSRWMDAPRIIRDQGEVIGL